MLFTLIEHALSNNDSARCIWALLWNCLTNIPWVNRWWMGGWFTRTSSCVFLSQPIAKYFFFFFFFFFFFPDWFFVIELVIQVYQLKYFLPINPPLSSYIYIYRYFFFFFGGGDVCMYCRLNKFIYLFINFFYATLLVCVCCSSYCASRSDFCSPFSQR